MGADGPVDLGTTDCTDLNLWKPLNDTNVIPQPIVTAALKAFKLDAGTSAAYYAVIARNDIRGDAEAYAHKNIGALVAFNTVGWQADNILFQAIDALLGSSYLTHENPEAARAYL